MENCWKLKSWDFSFEMCFCGIVKPPAKECKRPSTYLRLSLSPVHPSLSLKIDWRTLANARAYTLCKIQGYHKSNVTWTVVMWCMFQIQRRTGSLVAVFKYWVDWETRQAKNPVSPLLPTLNKIGLHNRQGMPSSAISSSYHQSYSTLHFFPKLYDILAARMLTV